VPIFEKREFVLSFDNFGEDVAIPDEIIKDIFVLCEKMQKEWEKKNL
jgi:hypothetical protein